MLGKVVWDPRFWLDYVPVSKIDSAMHKLPPIKPKQSWRRVSKTLQTSILINQHKYNNV